MENQITEKHRRNDSNVKGSLCYFEAARKKIDYLPNNIKWQEDCHNTALYYLDCAIEEQAKLEDTLEEGSDHYKLCFQKIQFLEEIDRHDVACKYCENLVKGIPEYSNILIDAADHYLTAGEPEKGTDYHEIWVKASNEE